jgi:hypothetical protein
MISVTKARRTPRRGAHALTVAALALALVQCRRSRTSESDDYLPLQKDAGAIAKDAGRDAGVGRSGPADATGGAGDGGDSRSKSADGGTITLGDGGALESDRDDAPERVVSDELNGRARHLFEALAQDIPALGRDSLYPRDGFVKRRDIKEAGRVWDRKVEAQFKKDLHLAHKAALRQAKSLDRAAFQRLELGSSMERIAAAEHEWRTPLYRVAHSKLWFTVEERAFHMDIAEMVSFRGAWYILRLK